MTRGSTPRAWLGLAARLVTGAVWIWAGAAKLVHPDQSVLAVRSYQLLPHNDAAVVGHLLPVVEVVVGALLVLGLMTRLAGVVSAGLFVAFILAIASIWARGINVDCGCFGGGGYDPHAASKYPWEIARDVGLLLLSLFLVWSSRTRLSLDRFLLPSTTEESAGTTGSRLDAPVLGQRLDHSGA